MISEDHTDTKFACQEARYSYLSGFKVKVVFIPPHCPPLQRASIVHAGSKQKVE